MSKKTSACGKSPILTTENSACLEYDENAEHQKEQIHANISNRNIVGNQESTEHGLVAVVAVEEVRVLEVALKLVKINLKQK